RTTDVPEPEQRPGQAHERRRIPALVQPLERDAEVPPLHLQPVKPGILSCPLSKSRPRLLREREKIRRVSTLHNVLFPGGHKLFMTELLNRPKHAESRLTGIDVQPLEQALVSQRGNAIE